MPEPDAVVDAHEKYALPLAFAEDGDLYSGGFDGTVARWATTDWTEVASVQAHEQSVNDGAVTTDGQPVTGSTDTTLGVWTADLADRVATLRGHENTVAGVAIHPADPLVASASYDGTVRVWNLTTDDEPRVLSGHAGNVRPSRSAPRGRRCSPAGSGTRSWSGRSPPARN